MTIAGFADLRRRIADLPVPQPLDGPCLIYGAGGFGRRVARELRRLGLPVAGFIDRQAGGLGTVEGLPCHHPDALPDALVRGAAYVHGLMNHYACSRPVADWAAARGFRRLVFPGHLAAIPGIDLDHYWLTAPATTRAALDAIESFHDTLADAESRALLRTLLLYRLETDPRRHPPVDVGRIYRPDFLALADAPLTFVDAGAFTGDSLEGLLAAGLPLADWVAFEPDAANMRALGETARRHRAALPSATLIPAGLSDANARVRFSAGEGASSAIAAGDPSQGTTVEVVRLDDVLHRSGPLYIKLDIEGAEAAALRGMAGHLARRPRLAVSVYHRPADLWELPGLVADLYPRPAFRLRQHGHHAFDTVLYVTPA